MKNHDWPRFHEKLLQKHDFKCVYCDLDFLAQPSAFAQITFDHFTPRSAGGTDEVNLLPACRFCNSLKGPKTFDSLEEARAALSKRRAEYLKRWGFEFFQKQFRHSDTGARR